MKLKTVASAKKKSRRGGPGSPVQEIATDKPWPTVLELRKLMEARGPDALLKVCPS